MMSRPIQSRCEVLGPDGDREAILNSWRLRSDEREKKRNTKPKSTSVNLGGMFLRRVVIWPIILLAAAISLLIYGAARIAHTHHQLPPPPPADYINITVALQKALLYFNAQKSGKLPASSNISWRGDSCLNDGRNANLPYTTDLVGGYYEDGDIIKNNFPTSFAMTMLSWGVIEYGPKFEALGELGHVKGLIKWGTDYFLKCFDSSTDTITDMVSQVGSWDTWPRDPNNGSCWIRPEDVTSVRPVLKCSECTDLAAEMAAALAAASLVFKDDMIYSTRLIRGARALFKFATNQKHVYSAHGSTDSFSYNSSSFWDEFVWGGAWMYYATGDLYYLQLVTDPTMADRAGAFRRGPDFGVLSWDQKIIGAQVLLTRLRLFLTPPYPYEEILREYYLQVNTVMCSYLPYYTTIKRTRGGLIQLNQGSPQLLQYVVNAAFLATLYGDYLDASGLRGWYCGSTLYHSDALHKFAESQVHYILGKNPMNMSYVVGFGYHYPRHVHHRGASIPKHDHGDYNCSDREKNKWRDTSKPNPNTIVGAMVGGPDRSDRFIDVRTLYSYTQPSNAGNAGLVSALIALSGDRSAATRIDINKMFSGIPPTFEASPPPPSPWKP